MSADAVPRWSHIGLCVGDLARSMRFYCEGLGCEAAERYELDAEQLPGLGQALEVGDRAAIVSQMITHGGLRIELLEWKTPAAEGSPSQRRNQLGLTHLSFWVAAIDPVVARLQALGGTLLPTTRQRPGIDLVFLADPDGTRVELMATG
jgi:catechol 2,3-dioxygenase-like lactoylglutathione lyase family enzyme